MFGFDYVLASKIAIHLLNAGWSIYDAITMANYEAGGIPSTGPGYDAFLKEVSKATRKSPQELKAGLEYSRYNRPSRELINQYQRAQYQRMGFLSSMPSWAWIMIAIGGLWLIKGEIK